MPGKIIIANPQNRVKDCYAPAPRIDLTLRSNGEEQVSVIDSLGRVSPAGLVPPSAAPTETFTAGADSFEDNKYWEYRYVYVAKTNYPLVENATTGGSSQAPRSNPSPGLAANSAVAGTHTVKLPTTNQSGISHIWIYRTALFDTAAQAKDFSDGGVLFWIGEVANNPNVTTVSFLDDGSAIGFDQIENDNFAAPQFQYCVFVDPYFYGFANLEFTAEVDFAVNGFVSIIDPSVHWFDGRNGQTVTIDGLEAGGYDNTGKFYFKQLSLQTGQLYIDSALTIPASLPGYGTSKIHIFGPATTLYRSKPRNPFSWGYTDIIGDIQIPQPYALTVGGKQGTAISVIPNINLLKLDVEGPNSTYTFNLRNAGTPNFEDSRRTITDQYCVSSHFTQFSATIAKGRNVLWGIDQKSYSILECDGATQQSVSDKVCQTMRSLALTEEDMLTFHGCYHPRAELNCMFVRTKNTANTNFCLMIGYHWPTDQWMTADMVDVTASGVVLDRVTKETKILVGNESGTVGELFAPDFPYLWFEPYFSSGDQQPGYGTINLGDFGVNQITVAPPKTFWDGVNPLKGLIGSYVTIIQRMLDGTQHKFLCRIATVANAGLTVTFDKTFKWSDKVGWVEGITAQPAGGTTTSVNYYCGLIEMLVGRSFTAQIPFKDKNLREFLTNWIHPSNVFLQQIQEAPYFKLIDTYPNQFLLDDGKAMVSAEDDADEATTYVSPEQMAIDYARVYGIIVRDRNYMRSSLINAELRINPNP